MTVQKLRAGFGEKVEIVFNLTGDMISLASEVFNNTGLLFSNFRSHLRSIAHVILFLFTCLKLIKLTLIHFHFFVFFFLFSERIIVATLHKTEEGMLTWKQSNE